jgi:hypothetical protein
MRRWIEGGLAALLLAIMPAIAKEPPVAPFRAEYVAARNGSDLGTAHSTLTFVEGETWEFLTQTRGTSGLAALARLEVMEKSEFRWHGLLPELIQYDYRQRAAWSSRERSLRVDAGAGTIASKDRDKSHTLAFEPGVSDRSTVALAIAAALAAGATELRFRVADRESVEWQTYHRTGTETIMTPAGSFETIRVERVREKPGRTTTSWIAPSHGYVPVRILHRETDGETFDLRLVRLER